MANAKKRTRPSSSQAKPSGGGKRLKLANKKSSKSSSHGQPPSRTSKQKTVDDVLGGGASKKARTKSREEDKDKDKGKGKGRVKEFVDLPGAILKSDGSDEESEGELDVQDMLAESGTDNDALENGGTEEGSTSHDPVAFLTRLDKKGLTRSRASLKEEYRSSKAALPTASAASRKDSTLPKIGPAAVKTNDENEELLDELSEDDFARLGSSEEGWESDSLDDELSVMSEASDSEDMSEPDNDSLGEDEGVEHISEDDDEMDEWGGINNGLHSDTSSNTIVSDAGNVEDKYAEAQARRQRLDKRTEGDKVPSRLPIKTASGLLENRSTSPPSAQAVRSRVAHERTSSAFEEDEDLIDDQELERRKKAAQPRPNPLGARFGRPAVISVLEIEDRAERLNAAREELATLGRETIAEPELGMNLLKRLLSFALPVFLTPGTKKDEGMAIDLPVRSMAMLSLLAVFLDIIPGYRIRPITEQEKHAKTSQAVVQQREYEDGLVGTYRRFLEVCENEIKGDTPLAPVALKCLCELLKEKSHFNFAINVMEIICKTLGRRDYDSSSDLCVSTLSHVLSSDITGSNSLQIVRLLSRTIKARSYLVHPSVLACLMSLRIKDLGGVRASTDRIDRLPGRKKFYNDTKGKDAAYLNKKARKAIREKKDIEKEIQEAELTVKEEERTHNSTETLKLLFALYFRILKLPVEQNSPLLPAALEGLARFSQLVNVDFFRDLLNTLKEIMVQSQQTRTSLMCIVTALDLLSGQGEALNIDLGAFITHLYTLLLPLAVSTSLEERATASPSSIKGNPSSFFRSSEADLLFRSLNAIFLTSRLPNPPVRSLAFSKRLLIAALHWPSSIACKTIEFVRQLLVKERSLEAMLSTEDRRRDGVYRCEVNEESLSNPDATVWWELGLLERSHFDEGVRVAASRLTKWEKDS